MRNSSYLLISMLAHSELRVAANVVSVVGGQGEPLLKLGRRVRQHDLADQLLTLVYPHMKAGPSPPLSRRHPPATRSLYLPRVLHGTGRDRFPYYPQAWRGWGLLSGTSLGLWRSLHGGRSQESGTSPSSGLGTCDKLSMYCDTAVNDTSQ